MSAAASVVDVATHLKSPAGRLTISGPVLILPVSMEEWGSEQPNIGAHLGSRKRFYTSTVY